MNQFFEIILQNIKRFVNRQTMYFVHNSDLSRVLLDLNIYQDIIDNKIHCSNCDNLISLNNIACIKKQDEKIILFCNSDFCKEIYNNIEDEQSHV